MFGMGNTNIKRLGYREVGELTLHRQGAAGRAALAGLLIGAGIGMIGGVIAGSGSSDSWFKISTGEAVLSGVLVCGGGGGLLGLLLGSISEKTFKIKGNRAKHRAMKYDVLRKIYETPTASVTNY